mmetsp:Transcript_11981/g.25661  ORF Transcript_11981/g.25661 Transcript_11981/m.25661 type:complete len:118 (-) Transcript_11981:225-578(-)
MMMTHVFSLLDERSTDTVPTAHVAFSLPTDTLERDGLRVETTDFVMERQSPPSLALSHLSHYLSSPLLSVARSRSPHLLSPLPPRSAHHSSPTSLNHPFSSPFSHSLASPPSTRALS